MLKTFSLGEFNIQKKECMWMYLWEVSQQQMTHTRQYFCPPSWQHDEISAWGVLKNYETLWIASCSIRCWSPNVTRSVVMVSWFTRNYCGMRTNVVYFRVMRRTVPSRLKLTMKLTMREPASMTTDTWSRRVTSWLQQRIKSKGFITTSDFPYDILSICCP